MTSIERAEDFYRQLVVRLGAGYDVQLDVTTYMPQVRARLGPSECLVAIGKYGKALHYVVSVSRDSNCFGSGETISREEAFDAVDFWFQGVSFSEFSERYPFVDPIFTEERKEALRRLRAEVYALAPALKGRITWMWQKHGSVWPFEHLKIDEGWRYCRLALQKDGGWKTSLVLGEFELCNGSAATLEEILVPIQRWVCDLAMPSNLKAEFPWMQIVNEELLPYFEEDKGWEGTCFLSWKRMEAFYGEFWKDPQSLKEIQNLMAEMSSRGFDKTLRAGQSMWSLILSRSQEYELREDQPRIAFWFKRQGMELGSHWTDTERLKFPSLEYTPELDALLRQLEAHDID